MIEMITTIPWLILVTWLVVEFASGERRPGDR